MDTGGLNIKITTDANLPIEASETLMRQVNELLGKEAELLRVSGSIGSEAGVLSIGTGSGIDHLSIVATYVDRFHRDKDIWTIARGLREKIIKLPHVKTLEVAPYGATALASIRANVDTLLSSDNPEILPEAGRRVRKALDQTKGVVSTAVTWTVDKVVYDLKIDETETMRYGLTRTDLLGQVQRLLRGAPVATFPRINSRDYLVRVWLPREQMDHIDSVLNFLMDTPKGKIPLSKFATVVRRTEPNLITRQGLAYTLEVYGNRDKAAISHIMQDYAKHLKEVKLPHGVTMEEIGDEKQFNESAKRMIGAIVVAVALIFLTLVVMFGNLKISAMILFSIPLTLIGAAWTLLIMDYHISMPAMMGFILLSGIIVNNAILLIHFAMEQIKAGMDKRQAMLDAIRIRTRPVLMTAFSVSAGMLPVAQGAAIGLERLAPLGAVAIGGLLIGTFMTLVFIPAVFIWTVREDRIRQGGA